LNRSVVAFDAHDWTTPALAVVDTNVIVEALLEDEPEHFECARLVQRLDAERTTLVFSRMLEMELWETVFNIGLRMQHTRKRLRHVRYYAEARNQAIELLDGALRGWEEILESVPSMCIELDEVAGMVPDLMRNYGFQSYDAVHVATLLVSGASDLITRDNGFAALLPEDARIHTTQARLATTRDRRRRALARRASGLEAPV